MHATRSIISFIAVACIAVLVYAGFRIPASPTATAAPEIEPSMPVLPRLERDPTPSAFVRMEVEDSSRRILLVQDISCAPIAGASCVILAQMDRIATNEPLAVSGPDGLLEIPAKAELQDGDLLGVGAEGYGPQYLHVLESGTVTLAPHDSVVGHAVDAAGQPVADVTVALSKHSINEIGSYVERSDEYRMPGFGGRAVYSARTDASGAFRVRGVPPGRYKIAIAHESYCVIDAGTENGAQFVDAPGPQLTIVMAQAYVAALDIRGGEVATAALRHPKWSATSALARIGLRRFMEARGLNDEWSGHRVRYYMLPDLREYSENLVVPIKLYPLTAEPFTVGIPVRPVGGTGPIKVVDVNQLWEPSVAKVSVTDVSGQHISGVKVSLGRLEESGLGAMFAVGDGETVMLPRGRYRVAPMSPLLKRTLGKRRQQVIEVVGGEVDVSIQFPIPCRQVVIRSDEVAEFGGKINLRGDQPGYWWNQAVQAGSSAEFWLPLGPYTAKVQSFGFETKEFGVSVVSGRGPQEVVVGPLAWSAK